MKWVESKRRIRRFLRDPEGKIWDDRLLSLLWNDSQQEINLRSAQLETVAVIAVPPRYGCSYMHDWEYEYAAAFGKPYQCWRQHHAAGMSCSHVWETQPAWGVDSGAALTDLGMVFMHPWEAWYSVGDVQDLVPLPLPEDFGQAQFVAYDKDAIDATTYKDLQSRDESYRTRTGEVQYWFRIDETSNEFYLYPRNSTAEWDDVSGAGQILYDDSGDTDSVDYGVIGDWPPDLGDMDIGAVFDALDADGNVLMVYKKNPTNISGGGDEVLDWPDFLTKYVEFGVLERSYEANTDGRIESLRDYWSMRRQVGEKVLRLLKTKKLVDRNFVMTTHSHVGSRNRQHPRLPDTYPAAR